MYGHSYNGYGGRERDQYGSGEDRRRERDQYGQAGRGRESDQYGFGQSSSGSSYRPRYQDQTRGGGGYGQWCEEGRGRTWTRENGGGGWSSASYRTGAAGSSSSDLNLNRLKPFVKDFFSYSAPCRALEASLVLEFRQEKEIKIMKGEESCPNPVITFADGGFPDYINKEVIKAGFTHPTPIQAQSFTIALSGQVRR